MKKSFSDERHQHLQLIQALACCDNHIEEAGALIVRTFQNGGKLLLCGNGGSAADAQHIAAEFVVRYEQKRRALPAIALTTDTSILTAHANDFEFESVFDRQIQALGNEADTLIAISTSGHSKNICQAAQCALSKKLHVIALTGESGGLLKDFATLTIQVPSTITARIQEAHILIGHYWCGVVESAFVGER